ncbi:DUF2848 family protein [Comamonas testosteroni]|uniref:DUF2848 family protein n=1 Tax=Comamonas testosteroni TaxID=285 RepID=UPI00389A64EC
MNMNSGTKMPLMLSFNSLSSPPVQQTVLLDKILIASWTGRDPTVVEQRISELEKIGIPRPPNIPMLYQIAKSRVTVANSMEVIGSRSTGEVEFLILSCQGRLWVGVGSDHTDRELEQHNAALAKQLCDKPIAADFWCFEDVANHWDSLQLKSFVYNSDGLKEEYQQGTVASMLHPKDLINICDNSMEPNKAGECYLVFCGTLPTNGPIRSGVRFEIALIDPILDRALSHSYTIESLPDHLTPLRFSIE